MHGGVDGVGDGQKKKLRKWKSIVYSPVSNMPYTTFPAHTHTHDSRVKSIENLIFEEINRVNGVRAFNSVQQKQNVKEISFVGGCGTRMDGPHVWRWVSTVPCWEGEYARRARASHPFRCKHKECYIFSRSPTKWDKKETRMPANPTNCVAKVKIIFSTGWYLGPLVHSIWLCGLCNVQCTSMMLVLALFFFDDFFFVFRESGEISCTHKRHT